MWRIFLPKLAKLSSLGNALSLSIRFCTCWCCCCCCCFCCNKLYRELHNLSPTKLQANSVLSYSLGIYCASSWLSISLVTSKFSAKLYQNSCCCDSTQTLKTTRWPLARWISAAKLCSEQLLPLAGQLSICSTTSITILVLFDLSLLARGDVGRRGRILETFITMLRFNITSRKPVLF